MFVPQTTNIVSATSLFSNNVGVSYHRLSTSGLSGHTTSEDVSATAYLGASDVFVQASSTIGGNADFGSNHGIDAASLGYRFKNVSNSIDVVVAVSSNDTVRVAAYREIGNGFAVAAQVSYNSDETQYGLGLSYKFTKEISLDANYVHVSRDGFAGKANDLSAGLRYSF